MDICHKIPELPPPPLVFRIAVFNSSESYLSCVGKLLIFLTLMSFREKCFHANHSVKGRRVRYCWPEKPESLSESAATTPSTRATLFPSGPRPDLAGSLRGLSLDGIFLSMVGVLEAGLQVIFAYGLLYENNNYIRSHYWSVNQVSQMVKKGRAKMLASPTVGTSSLV